MALLGNKSSSALLTASNASQGNMVRRAGPLYLLAFVLRAQHAVAVLQAAQLTLQLPRSCLLQAWTNTQMLQPPAKLRAAQALHRHCEDRTSTANILTKSNRMQAVATGAPCKVVWPCVAPYSIALLAKVLLTCPAWVTYLPATPAPPPPLKLAPVPTNVGPFSIKPALPNGLHPVH